MKNNDEGKLLIKDKRSLLAKLSDISGMEAINRILELADPSEMIKELSPVDFFWLVKRIGEEDAQSVLSFASDEQWQYLLDMEIWKKDRLNHIKILSWFEKLYRRWPNAAPYSTARPAFH